VKAVTLKVFVRGESAMGYANGAGKGEGAFLRGPREGDEGKFKGQRGRRTTSIAPATPTFRCRGPRRSPFSFLRALRASPTLSPLVVSLADATQCDTEGFARKAPRDPLNHPLCPSLAQRTRARATPCDAARRRLCMRRSLLYRGPTTSNCPGNYRMNKLDDNFNAG